MKEKINNSLMLPAMGPTYIVHFDEKLMGLQLLCFDPARVVFNPFRVPSILKYNSLLRHY